MASAGFLIYSGIMPLIKTFLTILFGYVLARRNLFPPAASRGASEVTMNVALPALLFANIVPAFTPANVSAIGPLLLIAFVYVTIGFILGFIIREICYVPRNFYQGIVVLTGMSNWGNLPTAIVLTVTQEAPFDPKTDPALGISFVAIFIVAYNLAFFVFGAANSLAWDYLPNVPQGEEAERRVSWKEKPIGGWISRVLRSTKLDAIKDTSAQIGMEKRETDENLPHRLSKDAQDRAPAFEEAALATDLQIVKRTSILSFRSRLPSAPPLPTFRASTDAPAAPAPDSYASSPSPRSSSTQLPTDASPPPSYIQKLFRFSFTRIFPQLSPLLTPITLTLLISLPIALIQRLKALFVDVTSLGGPAWKGPDGRPPLYFVIDTAAFVGGITVPMALVLLGASFARLSIPRPISRLAIPAMFAVAFAKMLILPVIGIFMIRAMVKGGLIPKFVSGEFFSRSKTDTDMKARENKVEIFVAMFLGGTPAAVNQLIVTQLYAPDGNVDTLSAFLLVQYVLMFFASAALTAVSLSLL